MIQRAYLKWVITTCEQASLFSIYLLCHTEELYLQFKINFSCELKSIIQKKSLKYSNTLSIQQNIPCSVHHIPKLLITFNIEKVSLAKKLSENIFSTMAQSKTHSYMFSKSAHTRSHRSWNSNESSLSEKLHKCSDTTSLASVAKTTFLQG